MSTINSISAREKFFKKFNQMVSKNTTGCGGSSSNNNGGLISEKWYHECFCYYDKNKDGFLDKKEFDLMVNDIFNSSSSSTESSPPFSSSADIILSLLDEDNDNRLGFKETRWKTWLKSIMEPVSALIVVDVQNDFIDGSLALKRCPAGQDGASVIPVINHLLSAVSFDVKIYSLDWHDEGHISFIDNLHLRKLHPSSPVTAENAKVYDTVIFSNNNAMPHTQVMWPKHCVQDTWGSQLHSDLHVDKNSIQVHKGTNTDVDSYSAFFDNQRISQTELESILRARNVTDVYVCGLAYDVCVQYTALDAIDLRFRTYLIDDASKGVNLKDIEQTKKKITEKGVRIINAGQVKELIESKECDIDIGLWGAEILSMAHSN